MGDYVFTDPDGRQYYASGESPDAAFSAARPIAQADVDRLMGERKPAGASMEREMQRGAEINRESARFHRENDPTILNELAATAIPGYGPLMAASKGNYEEAAGEAALQVLPLSRAIPRPVAKAALAGAGGLYGATTGESIAADEPLSFITDPKDRAAAAAMVNKIRGDDRAETSRLRADKIDQLRKEYQGRADVKAKEQKEEAQRSDAVERFNARNADIIKSLSKDEKAQLDNQEVPGDVYATLKAKGAYLDSLAKRREKATAGFAANNPEAMEWIQKGSYLASGAIPIGALYLKAQSLNRAAREAEEAYAAATRATGVRKQAAANDMLTIAKNQLKDARAGSGIGLATVAGAPLVPLAAAEAPNLIDLAQLQNHPDSPAFKHAWEMVNPWATDKPWYESPAFQTGVRALEEGAEATAAGLAIGEPIALARMGHAGRTSRGTLAGIEEREGRIAQEAETKAQASRDRAAKKDADKAARDARLEAEAERTSQEARRKTEERAASRAARATERTQAADTQRIEGADALKRDYAEKQAAADQANRELADAVRQIQTGKSKTTDALGPGGGTAAGALGPGGGGYGTADFAPRKYATVNGPVGSDPLYVYHATNAERADEVASSGLRLHEPHEFTDQEVWPDGSTQRRNYFTETAKNTWQFAPEEGQPVLLRIKKDAHPFRRESTGDLYSTKLVPPESIEYLDSSGLWRPLDPGVGGVAEKKTLTTETPAFRNWFGNSQVTDTNGNPLVVYHGTKAGRHFDEFDPMRFGQHDKGWLGEGFYFSSDPTVGEAYGNNIYPVYLRAENLFDMKGHNFNKVLEQHGGPAGFSQWLRDNGYDGAKMWSQIMVLNPNQIKSAIGNRGTFDILERSIAK